MGFVMTGTKLKTKEDLEITSHDSFFSLAKRLRNSRPRQAIPHPHPSFAGHKNLVGRRPGNIVADGVSSSSLTGELQRCEKWNFSGRKCHHQKIGQPKLSPYRRWTLCVFVVEGLDLVLDFERVGLMGKKV